MGPSITSKRVKDPEAKYLRTTIVSESYQCNEIPEAEIFRSLEMYETQVEKQFLVPNLPKSKQ